MNVMLIDDHPLVLTALQSVVHEFDKEAYVITARTSRRAQEILDGGESVDLALLDLHLGDCNGFELLEILRSRHPSLPVVVISASDSNEDVARSIYLGAMGFIPKRASNATLIEALRSVISGQIYVPPMSLRSSQPPTVTNDLRGDATVTAARRSDSPPSGRLRGDMSALGLTRRQAEVLSLLMKGQSNKLIARALNLSVETVKDHVAAILRTLDVNTRTQAVLAVNQLGLGAFDAERPSDEPVAQAD